jgi:hypothetical protein
MRELVAARVFLAACSLGASVHFGVPCRREIAGAVGVAGWTLQVSRRYSNHLHHSRHCQQVLEHSGRPICMLADVRATWAWA